MTSSVFRTLLFVTMLPVVAACAAQDEGVAPDSSSAGYARLGGMLRDKGDMGASIDFYRRALSSDARNFEARKNLAEVMEKWGDKNEAMKLYREGVELHPANIDLLRGYGRMLLAADKPAEAKKQYQAALEVNDSDTKSLSGMGVALDYLGDHKKAQEFYKEALGNDPENLATLNNLAYSYILTKRYDEAIKLLEPRIEDSRATPALRQNLALAYGLSGLDIDAERVARMDLSPEKVQQNLDYYRRQRAELAVTTAPYAELGTYATEAMAMAQIDKLSEQVQQAGGDLKPVILPEVSSPGGTPRFTVRMMGCTRPDDVTKLCDTLSAVGIPCVPRGKNLD